MSKEYRKTYKHTITALKDNKGNVISPKVALSMISIFVYLGLVQRSSFKPTQKIKNSVKEFMLNNADPVLDLVEIWVKKATNDKNLALETVNLMVDCINNMNHPENLPELTKQLVKNIRATERALSLKGDTETFDTTKIDLLDKSLSFLANPDSDSAFKNIQRNAHRLSNDIASLFIKQADINLDEFSILVQNLLKARSKITDRKSLSPLYALSEEKKKAKEEGLIEELKLYNKNEELVKTKINIFLRSLADKEKDKLISTQKAWEAMKAAKINVWPFHPQLKTTGDFVTINIAGQLCTTDGIPLVGMTPNPNYVIRRNPNYNPESEKPTSYLALDPVKNPSSDYFIPQKRQHVYTEKGVQDRSTKKSSVTLSAIEEIEKLKPKWRNKMNDNIESNDDLMPYIVEYMYNTASRFGDTLTGKNPDKPTFGAATFKVKHILNLPKKGGNIPTKLKIKYPVKGAHNMQLFIIDSLDNNLSPTDKKAARALIEVIVSLAEAKIKTPEAILFTVSNSKITTQEFNKWLKTHVSSDITSHSFRHVRGTMLFNKSIEELKPAADKEIKQAKTSVQKSAVVNNMVKEAATRVGELLGHVSKDQSTHTTAIKNYITPVAIRKVYEDYQVAPNMTINKAMNRDRGN
jgi:hypothetical protein